MLCGGEPTIVPHFFEVAERLGAAGVQLKIETNGQTMDAAMAARLAKLPIRSVQISLDGDSEAVYRSQRPGGSLARAHEACRLVRQAGMTLEITFAPTRLNIHEAEAVIARARTFGALRFNTGKLMPIGRAARLWQKIALLEEDYAVYRQVLDRQAAQIDRSMQLCYEPFSVEDGLRQSLGSPPATLLVLPNGLVRLTGACDHICGDVRRMDLTDIWNQYRAAWHDEAVLAAIRRDIEASSRADQQGRQVISKGVMEHA
jgi:MoaA/NifB/PqqE/SkfB family radical SAM enzyme